MLVSQCFWKIQDAKYREKKRKEKERKRTNGSSSLLLIVRIVRALDNKHEMTALCGIVVAGLPIYRSYIFIGKC